MAAGRIFWDQTQTVPPTGMAAAALSSSSIRVSWTPIPYTGDTGGYRVYYKTASDPVFSYGGATVNKSADHLDVTGLNPSTTYFFRVQTRTEPHGDQQNILISPQSAEVSATTLAPCFTPAVTEQPLSRSVLEGQGVTFSVSASGSAPRSYQWFRGVSGDTTSPVGGDANTYGTGPLYETTSYWVRVTNACGQADSRTATVLVFDAAFDLTGDGVVDFLDGQALAEYLAGTRLELPCGPGCGDLDGDGTVSVLDYHVLLRALAGA